MLVAISAIRESKSALRGVNKNNEQYLGLVESIRSSGVFQPIVVREETDPTTGETYYILVDGLQRFNASKDAGLVEIPVVVKDLAECDVYAAQIMTNIHRVETRPCEYTKQLQRMIAAKPMMTMCELAKSISKSTEWVNQRLSLVKLDPEIQKLVDDGSIRLSNAFCLAKLPVEEQRNYMGQAMTDAPTVFMPTCNARAKEIRDAERKGRDPSKSEFTPVPHIRSVSEIKETYTNPAALGGSICGSVGATTPEAGFQAALAWVLSLDPASVALQKAKYEELQAKKAAETEKRKKEAEERKIQKAAEKAAKAEADSSIAKQLGL